MSEHGKTVWAPEQKHTDTGDDGTIRHFSSGATRDTAYGKLDYEGFLSPAVLRQFARYMQMNRLQSDGTIRDADNWQRGIPAEQYMKSNFRHFMTMWDQHRRNDAFNRRELMAAMCGVLFNTMGYMHEWLKTNEEVRFDEDEPTSEIKRRQANV